VPGLRLVSRELTNSAKLDDRLPEAIEFANFLKDSKGYEQVSILGYCWGIYMSTHGDSSVADT